MEAACIENRPPPSETLTSVWRQLKELERSNRATLALKARDNNVLDELRLKLLQKDEQKATREIHFDEQRTESMLASSRAVLLEHQARIDTEARLRKRVIELQDEVQRLSAELDSTRNPTPPQKNFDEVDPVEPSASVERHNYLYDQLDHEPHHATSAEEISVDVSTVLSSVAESPMARSLDRAPLERSTETKVVQLREKTELTRRTLIALIAEANADAAAHGLRELKFKKLLAAVSEGECHAIASPESEHRLALARERLRRESQYRAQMAAVLRQSHDRAIACRSVLEQELEMLRQAEAEAGFIQSQIGFDDIPALRESSHNSSTISAESFNSRRDDASRVAFDHDKEIIHDDFKCSIGDESSIFPSPNPTMPPQHEALSSASPQPKQEQTGKADDERPQARVMSPLPLVHRFMEVPNTNSNMLGYVARDRAPQASVKPTGNYEHCAPESPTKAVRRDHSILMFSQAYDATARGRAKQTSLTEHPATVDKSNSGLRSLSVAKEVNLKLMSPRINRTEGLLAPAALLKAAGYSSCRNQNPTSSGLRETHPTKIVQMSGAPALSIGDTSAHLGRLSDTITTDSTMSNKQYTPVQDKTASIELDMSLELNMSDVDGGNDATTATQIELPSWTVSEMPRSVIDAESRLERLRKTSRVLKEEISRPIGKSASIDSLFDRFALRN